MKRNLAAIDALNLIHEKMAIIVKCITLYDIEANDRILLAYIAEDFLLEMRAKIQDM
ncbi:MAG: hypothetical protein FWD06_00115 [Oscillospiraceae bacterium]|nr:hypothetical protein [Oscillospiraceae bacterium]